MNPGDLKREVKRDAYVKVPQLVTNDGGHTPLMSWPLMVAYHTELVGHPAAKTSNAVAANTNFLNQMKELHKVQCRCCSGYGHTSKYCTTLPRVKAAMGPNPVTNGWLSRAIERAYPKIRPGIAPVDKSITMTLEYQLPEGLQKKKKKADAKD